MRMPAQPTSPKPKNPIRLPRQYGAVVPGARRLPGQRLLIGERPASLADRRLGIQDADLAELVAAALSRFICDSQSEAGSHTWQLGRLMLDYAHTDAALDDTSIPAPNPEVDRGGPATQAGSARKA